MPAFGVPAGGLSLLRKQDDKLSPNGPSKAPQAMRLNLETHDAKHILRSLQDDEKVRLRFGKRQTLIFGDKSIQLYAQPETSRFELYRAVAGKEGAVFLAGELSHRLETQEARAVLEGTDMALARLEETMKSMKEKKASNEAQIVNDKAVMGHKRNLSRDHARLSPFPSQRLINGQSSSRPGSPAVGAKSVTSTPKLAPTSAPMAIGSTLTPEDHIKMAAMKTPLIHMLAVEPHTIKELCLKIRCRKDLCKRLLAKHADEIRTDPGKFELRDKMFKELDLWSFKYPSQEVRQKAIERAITAFDRMKVTRKDEAWQMLLPKADRGKGTVLSRTNLQGAPRQLPPKVPELDAEVKTAATLDKLHRPVADPGKSVKGHARSDSLHSKSSKPTASENEEPKNKPKPKASTANATKSATKTSRSENTKYKSAEFVQDSDEDIDMGEAPPLKKPIAEPKEARTTKPTPKPAVRPPMAGAASSSQKDRAIKPAAASKAKDGHANRRPSLSRPRTNSSPRKPSPLGSSPPTNATDNESSGKDSSIIVSPPRPREGDTKKSSQGSKGADKPLTNGIKRKADTQDDRPDPKRRQPSSNVKDGEPRGRFQNRAAPSQSPVPDNNRALTSQYSSRRPSSSSSASALSSSGAALASSGSASPPDHEELEAKARQFKAKWEKYRDFHERVSKMGRKASKEDLDKLRKMQGRIRELKREIWREWQNGTAM